MRSLSKEFPKRSGANLHRSIYPSVIPLIWNGTGCLPENEISPITRTRRNGKLYLIISGEGSVRHKDGITEVVAGDAFIFRPDEAHQLINSREEDLIYYVIADNPIGESAYYPDSGKWKVNKSSAKDRVVIKGQDTDYFDGEE
jgi:uncharacterized cupin superfamily protein